MSKYLASYVPDQLLSMVTRIKEATIDVGPQPVRTAKFTKLPWSAVMRIVQQQPSEKSQSYESNQQQCECLLLSTDIAFEIWLVKSNANSPIQPTNVELECIYRHKEDMIEMIDFVQLWIAEEAKQMFKDE